MIRINVNIKYHIIFWVLYALIFYFIDSINGEEIIFFDHLVFIFFNPVSVFYLSYFTICNFNFKSLKQLSVSILILILTFLIFLLGKYFYRFVFIKLFNYPPYNTISLKILFGDALVWYCHFFLWAVGYYFLVKNNKTEKLLLQKEKELFEKEKINLNLDIKNQAAELTIKTLTIKNQELEKQKLTAEYNYLRTQINPHFLYNTLSFFYGKVAEHDADSAEGLMMLTNLMRYSLHKGDKQGRMPLALEIENLENFLTLQNLRFGNNLQLSYNREEFEPEPYKILPHLMITLVENAFKHGNNMNPQQPLTITLSLTDDTIYFSVTNLINTANNHIETTKTGLENLTSRLESIYTHKYLYEVTTTATTYQTIMQITLNTTDDIIITNTAANNDIVLKKTAPLKGGLLSIAAML